MLIGSVVDVARERGLPTACRYLQVGQQLLCTRQLSLSCESRQRALPYIMRDGIRIFDSAEMAQCSMASRGHGPPGAALPNGIGDSRQSRMDDNIDRLDWDCQEEAVLMNGNCHCCYVICVGKVFHCRPFQR